jgi:hypothetical protein
MNRARKVRVAGGNVDEERTSGIVLYVVIVLDYLNSELLSWCYSARMRPTECVHSRHIIFNLVGMT